MLAYCRPRLDPTRVPLFLRLLLFLLGRCGLLGCLETLLVRGIVRNFVAFILSNRFPTQFRPIRDLNQLVPLIQHHTYLRQHLYLLFPHLAPSRLLC